jgi:hypothetical protein
MLRLMSATGARAQAKEGFLVFTRRRGIRLAAKRRTSDDAMLSQGHRFDSLLEELRLESDQYATRAEGTRTAFAIEAERWECVSPERRKKTETLVESAS